MRSLSIVVVAMTACVIAGAAMAADTVDVPVILPMTGAGSFLGTGEKRALELAETAANRAGGIQKKALRFVFYDDQTSPQVAVQLANKIIADNPPVIIGSSIVAMCNAIAPLMQAHGPVQYCLSPGIHPAKGSYTFTSSVSTLDLVQALVRYFRLKGWTRIALMFSIDATGQDAENGFKTVLAKPENGGMTVVAIAHFDNKDMSVSAQLEQVKAADPQVFVPWTTGAAIATIFRGMAQAGLDVPTGTTDGNMTHAQMAQYATFLPKQLYFAAAQWVVGTDGRVPTEMAIADARRQFRESFIEANVKPDISSELAWDPAWIVIDALKKLGPDASAAQLRDHIASLDHYAGNNGFYDFTAVPQRGLGIENTVVTRWNAAADQWDLVAKPTGIPFE